MSLDANEVVVAGSGKVYVAPVGTAGPVDIATALNVAWKDLGYISEDGVNVTPSVDVGEVKAWQTRYPIRRFENARSLEVSFSLAQWDKTNLPFALGGGTVTTTVGPPAFYTYSPPVAGSVDERALLIEWADGVKDYRMHILRGMITDLGTFALSGSSAAMLEVTYSTFVTSGVAPFTIISDDPAWAV